MIQMTVPVRKADTVSSPTPETQPLVSISSNDIEDIQQAVKAFSSLSTGGNMNPNVLFATKVATGVIAAGIWIFMVYSGHDATTQENEIIMTCKGWVIGLVTHMMTKKA